MTGWPSLASGQSGLSACEMVTPITTDEPRGVTVLGRTVAGAGSPRLGRRRGRRRLGLDLLGRLVLAQALERGLAEQCRRR